MLQAVLIKAREDDADALERRQAVERRVAGAIAVEKPEAFFGERVKDVVFRGEVSVDGGGAVLDPFGNLADRNVLVALFDEQIAGGVQDGAANRLPFASLSLFDAHVGFKSWRS